MFSKGKIQHSINITAPKLAGRKLGLVCSRFGILFLVQANMRGRGWVESVARNLILMDGILQVVGRWMELPFFTTKKASLVRSNSKEHPSTLLRARTSLLEAIAVSPMKSTTTTLSGRKKLKCQKTPSSWLLPPFRSSGLWQNIL